MLMNRKKPNFSKIKPQIGHKYNLNPLLHSNMYIYRNPVHEEYISNYMEKTQS